MLLALILQLLDFSGDETDYVVSLFAARKSCNAQAASFFTVITFSKVYMKCPVF